MSHLGFFLKRAAILLGLAVPAYLHAGDAPTPAPTDTPTSATMTPTPAPTDTPSTSTMTPTSTPSPTATPVPTVTPTPTPIPRAVVRTTLRNSTPPFAPGSRIQIFIEVSENTTGLTPINANFEIRFDSRQLKYYGVQGGQLGTAIVGPVQSPGVDAYHLVTTLSNPNNRDATPTVMTMAFDVIAPQTSTLNITVADARNSSGPLIGPTSSSKIPHVFDNTAVQNLPIEVGLADLDGDGISNVDEATRGTNQLLQDTDKDGVEDGIEIALGTDPLLASDQPNGKVDTDADGLPDDRDSAPNNPDRDGDRIEDGYEVSHGTNPDDPASFPPLGDVNADGLTDFVDGVTLFGIYLGNLPGSIGDAQMRDVNRDGRVDSTDGVIIFNFHLGNFALLPF